MSSHLNKQVGASSWEKYKLLRVLCNLTLGSVQYYYMTTVSLHLRGLFSTFVLHNV
jgi:hypothetical protein